MPNASVQADIYKEAIPGGGTRQVFKSGGVQTENTPVSVTTATVTITADVHGGKTIVLSRAGGITATLPAATGTGVKFRFVVGTTFTGSGIVQVASGTDYMIGLANVAQDGGDTTLMFETANTGTVATETDTVTLNGTTTGGYKGAVIEVEDIATAVWAVHVRSAATGVEASPFSAAV